MHRESQEPPRHDAVPALRRRSQADAGGSERAHADRAGLAQALVEHALAEQARMELAHAARLAAATAATAAIPAPGLEPRLRHLVEAGRVLSSPLSIEETLASAVRLAVPVLADWCRVELRHDGRLVRHQTGADGAGAPLRAVEAPGDLGLPGVGDGRTIHVPAVDHGWLSGLAAGALGAALGDAGARTVLGVPLVARGRTIGALTLAMAGSGRAFLPDDVLLCEDLAQRVALCADGAMLCDEVRRVSAAKREFLAVMSHEFRTPLQAILGFAELLREGIPVPIPAAARERATRILQASEYMLQLVEQLLGFSRIEGGREVVRPQRFDLAHVAGDLVLLVEPLAAAKGLAFSVDAPAPDTLLMTSDPGKVRQILYNLLANSVKFTREGSVRLAVRADGDAHVLLEVSDTGVGLTTEQLGRAFDPFWQGTRETAVPGSGTGLGLTITHRLVHLLGGSITLESSSGAGTIARVRLPRETTDGPDSRR